MAPIIRTCSVAALALGLMTTDALAARPVARSDLQQYATARLAESGGEAAIAATAYAALMHKSPGNSDIAFRTYREAVEAGNRALALSAARTLADQNIAPVDARMLLFIDLVGRRDWAAANQQIDMLEPKKGLGFLVPVLRAWSDIGAGVANPLSSLDAIGADNLVAPYAREQRVLMQLFLKQKTEAIAALDGVATSDARGYALRIAAAAQLVSLNDKAAAVAVLTPGDGAVRRARSAIERGQTLPGAVNTPSLGAARLMARVATDLLRDRAAPAALMLARLAVFAAPGDELVALTLAQAQFANDDTVATLATLDTIGGATVYVSAVRELRIEALQQENQNAAALLLAQAGAAMPDASVTDKVLLGQSLSRLGRNAEAAAVYAALIKQLDDAPAISGVTTGAPWTLWLLYGGVLDADRNWTAAKPALERAVTLGGDKPTALNHLGYAMLENGGDIDVATRLIAKASALRPDDAAITDSLGWAFFKRGDTAQAITILERAVAGDPTISETAEHLGDAYWAAGRRIDARYTWRAALIQAGDDGATKRLQAKIADGPVMRAP